MSQLPEVIAALLNPAHYPDDAPAEVKLVQTQMSFVLLTGKHAYKIRKPVNLGYVDYTALEKRRLFSEKEVVLNRRMCPDAYLGVVPVTNQDGQISLSGSGEVVDYAVKMRQLPESGMMDRRLRDWTLDAAMIEAVAGKVAAFHAAAGTGGEIDKFGSLDSIRRNIDENFEQTRPYIGRALSQKQFDRLKTFFASFLKGHAGIFARRVIEGRIRDCHGDLHAAHICFTDSGICVFDCIEFNDRFRHGDTASEVAFLAMDLDRAGRADLRQAFVFEYLKQSGDTGLCHLLRFYQSYRAHVRAKVACFKLDDPFVPAAEKAVELDKARGYFDLAVSYTRHGPRLFITSGVTGCGKSAVATELARRQGLWYISSDITRKKLAGLPAAEPAGDAIGRGLYSPEMTEKTYASMMAEADAALAMWHGVIIDATFLRRADRDKAAALAAKHHAEYVVLDCQLPEDELKKRLERRQTEVTVSDGTWEIYLSQKTKMEPVTEIPESLNHVIINGLRPVAENVRQIIDYLPDAPSPE
ncbi:AAA family ATPase [Dehalogenimonas alkenigignens]|uniref:Aminoglycoside phosphotransferase domain-containing protein n=1 Tax=Dehalogenimonas alkenigignens TaxID=1217799 RepID=A0A0W0GFW2_9CHLR|nr:AAA family ATPase [Dehalogenimonas alkenigignens]KTB47448.1 hypothetical protein DEALK_02930 [Dehalogenimonas alkenigignens]PVV83491.1 hypothetical protein DD509_06565 [Dehalogenimonas alkenigignens]